jgi:catechol 2,3-dioxygenase-like lactoylglutathione lyase family enzyme
MKMSRLIPMLPVTSIEASVEFYERLGFGVEQRNDGWGWAMLRFDECRLMLDRSINTDPAAPRQSVLYLYPEKIAEYHEHLRTSGLAIPELEVTFYGMTEFRLEDPDGNRLWIGQNTSGQKGTRDRSAA